VSNRYSDMIDPNREDAVFSVALKAVQNDSSPLVSLCCLPTNPSSDSAASQWESFVPSVCTATAVYHLGSKALLSLGNLANKSDRMG